MNTTLTVHTHSGSPGAYRHEKLRRDHEKKGFPPVQSANSTNSDPAKDSKKS